nr:hypothetical protein [Rhizoctonia sp.]
MKNTLTLLRSWENISNAERIAAYIYPKDGTISTGSRNLESIKHNHECKSLVPYSKGLGSNIGMRLPTSVLSMIILTPEGFYLCSNGFSLTEQQVLQRILWINFGIRSTIHKHLDGYKLYIPGGSMGLFRSIVTPYFSPHFM